MPCFSRSAIVAALGRVDGFNQDKHTSQSHERGIVPCGLLTPHGDTAEAFEFADELLHPGTRPVEHLRKDFRWVLRIRTIRDDRHDATATSGVTVDLRVIALVRNHRPRITVGTEVQQRLELPAVAGLIGGQMKVEWMAVAVDLEVDFRAEPAT